MKRFQTTGQRDPQKVARAGAQLQKILKGEQEHPDSADHQWEQELPEASDDPAVTRAEA